MQLMTAAVINSPGLEEETAVCLKSYHRPSGKDRERWLHVDSLIQDLFTVVHDDALSRLQMFGNRFSWRSFDTFTQLPKFAQRHILLRSWNFTHWPLSINEYQWLLFLIHLTVLGLHRDMDSTMLQCCSNLLWPWCETYKKENANTLFKSAVYSDTNTVFIDKMEIVACWWSVLVKWDEINQNFVHSQWENTVKSVHVPFV